MKKTLLILFLLIFRISLFCQNSKLTFFKYKVDSVIAKEVQRNILQLRSSNNDIITSSKIKIIENDSIIYENFNNKDTIEIVNIPEWISIKHHTIRLLLGVGVGYFAWPLLSIKLFDFGLSNVCFVAGADDSPYYKLTKKSKLERMLYVPTISHTLVLSKKTNMRKFKKGIEQIEGFATLKSADFYDGSGNKWQIELEAYFKTVPYDKEAELEE